MGMWKHYVFLGILSLLASSATILASDSVNPNVMPPSLLPPVNLADDTADTTPPPTKKTVDTSKLPTLPPRPTQPASHNLPPVPTPTPPVQPPVQNQSLVARETDLLNQGSEPEPKAPISTTTRSIISQIKQTAWNDQPPANTLSDAPQSIQPLSQNNNDTQPRRPVLDELPIANWQQRQPSPNTSQPQQPPYNPPAIQQLPVQQPQQQQPPFTPPVTAPAGQESESGRIIQLGDLLDVRLINEADVNLQTRVGEDGSITLPFIGDVKVGGMPLSAANNKIKQKYSAFYRDPVLSLIIVGREFNKFSILGHVEKPGVYDIPQSRNFISLMEAIAMASGTGKFGDVGKLSDIGQITIRRLVEGKQTEVGPINGMDLDKPEKVNEYQVRPGDTVIVQLASNEFYMLGEVRAPGVYKLPSMQSSIDFMEAIAMAGGAVRVADLGTITVKRGKDTPLIFDAQALGRNQAVKDDAKYRIKAGDTVVVQLKKTEYVVLGQVAKPGKYDIPAMQDSIDLLEALATAGGPTRLANLSSVKVRRPIANEKDKEDVIEVNVNSLMNGKDSAPFMVKSGDRIIIGERMF